MFSGEANLHRESKSKFELELEAFFLCERPASTVDILDWWKKAEEKMPLLAQYVKKSFCIPATSANSGCFLQVVKLSVIAEAV